MCSFKLSNTGKRASRNLLCQRSTKGFSQFNFWVFLSNWFKPVLCVRNQGLVSEDPVLRRKVYTNCIISKLYLMLQGESKKLRYCGHCSCHGIGLYFKGCFTIFKQLKVSFVKKLLSWNKFEDKLIFLHVYYNSYINLFLESHVCKKIRIVRKCQELSGFLCLQIGYEPW